MGSENETDPCHASVNGLGFFFRDKVRSVRFPRYSGDIRIDLNHL